MCSAPLPPAPPSKSDTAAARGKLRVATKGRAKARQVTTDAPTTGPTRREAASASVDRAPSATAAVDWRLLATAARARRTCTFGRRDERQVSPVGGRIGEPDQAPRRPHVVELQCHGGQLDRHPMRLTHPPLRLRGDRRRHRVSRRVVVTRGGMDTATVHNSHGSYVRSPPVVDSSSPRPAIRKPPSRSPRSVASSARAP